MQYVRMKNPIFIIVPMTLLLLGCPKEDPASGTTTADSENASISPATKRCAPKLGNKTDLISHGNVSLNSCAVFENHVKCWGPNTYGELALGDTNTRGDQENEMGSCLPAIDLGLDQIIAIQGSNAGNNCALFSNGKVKCWGLNSLGNLGLEDTVDRITPSALGDRLPYLDLGTNVTATQLISANRTYCVITADEKIKCWGAFTGDAYNPNNPGFIGAAAGQMGDNLAYQNLPGGATAKKLSIGSSTMCAILNNSTAYCWNPTMCAETTSNNFSCAASALSSWTPLGTVPVGAPVKDIAMGTVATCVILTTGDVRCWGSNSYGELGQQDTVQRGVDTAHASEITTTANIDLGTGRTATKISAGNQHFCALLDNGNIKCWGRNHKGQLGLGDTNNRGDEAGEMGDNLPYVNLGTGRTALDVNSGISKTCALLDDHSVKCWGVNSEGNLGQGHITSIGDLANTMGDFLKPILLW